MYKLTSQNLFLLKKKNRMIYITLLDVFLIEPNQVHCKRLIETDLDKTNKLTKVYKFKIRRIVLIYIVITRGI